MEPSQAEIEVFERVMTGYYKKPDAAEAAQALSFLLRYTPKWKEPPGDFHMMYFFYRIAQVTPEAIEEYKKLRSELNEVQAKFIGYLLAGLGASQAPPSPLSTVGKDPSHLDCCWLEFFATGDPEAVRHIAKSLDLPDVTREQLEAWYLVNGQAGALAFLRNIFGNKTPETLKTLASVGIELSPETKKVTREDDLDQYCFGLAEQSIKIFTMLPFQLSPEQLGILAAKNAALWSLRNNARHHELVAKCCQEEAANPGSKLRQKLQEPMSADVKPYFP